MIDFVKIELLNFNLKSLEENPYLEFKTVVSTETGELSRFLHAYYKGLLFTIIEATEKYPTPKVTVEGSFHKFWNDGKHNYNDFGMVQINEVLHELKGKFDIIPENCILKQLELGVNINPPVTSMKVLQGCMLHKTKRFKWVYTKDEGSYLQCRHQRYMVKLYDKQKHNTSKGFELEAEILRFEVKFIRMEDWHKIGVFTLDDLINEFRLVNFIPNLLKVWGNVLFYDSDIFEGTKYEWIYNNQSYWESLNYEQLKYHRSKLNKMIRLAPENLKGIIAKLIRFKGEFLCVDAT